METGDDVTVLRDEVRAAIPLLATRRRRADRVVWLTAGLELETLLISLGEAKHAVLASGTWATPAEVSADRFLFLFRHGHLPKRVRITMFGGAVMIAETVMLPPRGAVRSPPRALPAWPPSPQGELFSAGESASSKPTADRPQPR